MSTNAMQANYHGEYKDSQDKFQGNIIVYIGWDHHCFHCASRAFPLPPQMPFAAVISDVMPEAFSQHPEYKQIDWKAAQWILNGQPFTPDWDRSLGEQGFDHKSLLRFTVPGLNGYAGAGV